MTWLMEEIFWLMGFFYLTFGVIFGDIYWLLEWFPDQGSIVHKKYQLYFYLFTHLVTLTGAEERIAFNYLTTFKDVIGG